MVLSVGSKVLLLWVAASVATVEVLPALDMAPLVLHMSVVDVVVSPATVALSASVLLSKLLALFSNLIVRLSNLTEYLSSNLTEYLSSNLLVCPSSLMIP